MSAPWLRVSDDRRKLVYAGGPADGRPFFYLADTAWELLHRLDRDETEHYLTTRASQGFTAVQTVLLGERDGLRKPTPAGEVPFHDLDPARPNEKYFEHVDWVVRRMNELGLVAALLPIWGDKVEGQVGQGPQVVNPSNARGYGRFVGARYRDAKVIWVMGGDRDLKRPPYLEVVREIVAGVKEGDGGRHLMTFHPPGRHTSSEFVHGEDWLDVHMWQTGHSDPQLDTAALIAKDRALDPRRPVFDGEPCYENIPVMGGGWNPTGYRFGAADARRRAYRGVFGGACGHTYGCNEVWMMHKAGDEQFVAANMDWRRAVHLPGANQMRHLRALVETRDFRELEPIPWADVVRAVDANVYGDSNLQRRVRWAPGPAPAEVARPTVCAGRAWCWTYLPMGSPVRVDLARVGGPVRLRWFDPRHGTWADGGAWTDAEQWVEPPAPGEDWVLVGERAGGA